MEPGGYDSQEIENEYISDSIEISDCDENPKPQAEPYDLDHKLIFCAGWRKDNLSILCPDMNTSKIFIGSMSCEECIHSKGYWKSSSDNNQYAFIRCNSSEVMEDLPELVFNDDQEAEQFLLGAYKIKETLKIL